MIHGGAKVSGAGADMLLARRMYPAPGTKIMANEIKNLLPMEPRRNAVTPTRSAAGGPAERSATKGAAPSGNDAKVTLTEAGQKLAQLSSEAAAGAPIDEARVASLRAALAEGRYQPDPMSIATALLRFEQGGK